VVHIPAFRSEGWEVAGVWSRRRERAEERAAEHGIDAVHDDWRELVEREDVDAIAVTTPPGPHHEMSMTVLRAGKHLLCEKPFALNATEAAEMRDASASTGLTAMVAHEFRFTPQRTRISELIDEGYIGEPQVAAVQLMMGRPAGNSPPPMGWGSRAAEGGGLLGALGSHYIDGLRHWFGDVVSVSGQVATLRPDRLDGETDRIVQADSDDTFSFTLAFSRGVMATMTASSVVTPSQGARILLTGTDGVLLATQPGPNPEQSGIVLGGKKNDRSLEELPMPDRLTPFEDERDGRLVSFRLLVREFERGIREGTPSPAPSFEDGWRCQQVLDAVRESSRTGVRVDIE
ncbi:MAG: Gfo/Idh/MocA family oxidoreductase, partial [Dehalococcoidia bacterium]|nr:Gfo/Idh/MocA family oxidoreductase [Dehalococcoidia bacterium]